MPKTLSGQLRRRVRWQHRAIIAGVRAGKLKKRWMQEEISDDCCKRCPDDFGRYLQKTLSGILHDADFDVHELL